MYRYLLAILLCLSLGAPWEAIGQAPVTVEAARDSMLSPTTPAALTGALALAGPAPGVFAVPEGYELTKSKPAAVVTPPPGVSLRKRITADEGFTTVL